MKSVYLLALAAFILTACSDPKPQGARTEPNRVGGNVNSPAPTAEQSLLDRAKAGFGLCMDHFPETKTTGPLLKDAGWRFETTTRKFRLYSQRGRRVLLATMATPRDVNGCLAIVSKLNEKEAIALAKHLMKSATSVKPAKRVEMDSVAEWTAVVNGRKVRFAAMKSTNFRIVYGAGVMMIDEK